MHVPKIIDTFRHRFLHYPSEATNNSTKTMNVLNYRVNVGTVERK